MELGLNQSSGHLNVNDYSIDRLVSPFFDVPTRSIPSEVRDKYALFHPSAREYYGDLSMESPSERARKWSMKSAAAFGAPDSMDKDPNRLALYHMMEVRNFLLSEIVLHFIIIITSA